MSKCHEIASTIYFEKQSKLMCGLHAINNLLGGRMATSKCFIKLADDMMKQRYHSNTNRKISLNEYISKLKPHLYDCKKGFFSPDIQNAYINTFTQYTLSKMKYRSITDKTIVKYAASHPKIYGFLLSVSKYYKTSKNTYNHSIAIRVFRSKNDPKHICVILLDSELDSPYILSNNSVFFDGESKIYSSINMIESLVDKTKEDIHKQSKNIIIDLTKIDKIDNEDSKHLEDLLHVISKSPKLLTTIKRKSKVFT